MGWNHQLGIECGKRFESLNLLIFDLRDVEVHLFFFFVFFAILPFGEKNPELKSPKEHLQSIQTEKKTHDSEKEINNKRFQKTHTTFSSKKLFMFWGSNTFCEFSIFFFFPWESGGFKHPSTLCQDDTPWHDAQSPEKGGALGALKGGSKLQDVFPTRFWLMMMMMMMMMKRMMMKRWQR